MSPFRWSVDQVTEALGVAPTTPLREDGFTGISTDTRSLTPGDLFVALEGERFDGHAFLDAAAAAGARGAVIRKDAPMEEVAGLPLFPVEDTLTALGALARRRRFALPARVVGITGSSGKTAVKELVTAALAGSYRTHATAENLNNRIGVPLTLLSAPEDAEFVVVEMGTSEPGEIAALAAIGVPDAAMVTTVSEAHLEGLGSLHGVLEEKLDLLRGMRNGGPSVVGDEPEELPLRARELRGDVRVAGLSLRADRGSRGELLEMDPQGRFHFRLDGEEHLAPLSGRHGVVNTLLALTLADALGVGRKAAMEGMAAVKPAKLRGEFRRVGGMTLLLDCYNANPQSTRAALDLLAHLPVEGGKVAILGSMLELGPEGDVLHEELLGEALALPIDTLVVTGAFARAAAGVAVPEGRARLVPADTPEEGFEALRPLLTGGETILLKGSRGVALERLIPLFESMIEATPARDGG